VAPVARLTSEEVQQQLAKFGFNEVPVVKRGWLSRLIAHFNNATAYMLELVIVIALVLRSWVEAGMVGGASDSSR
jgi:magnesium-transporting ATPase (P-type)